MAKKVRGLVSGVGINNADYNVSKEITVDGKRKLIWKCPYYSTWCRVIQRCYNYKSLILKPTYEGCYSVDDWHYFMTFRNWMEKQDWEGKHLDKDLLFPGNKVYGPDTCVFVDQKVNKFLLESTASRGEWPIGVSFRKDLGLFQASCCLVETGKQKNLGHFDTAEEAHEIWLKTKREQAIILASQQTDERVAKALIERYENYGK